MKSNSKGNQNSKGGLSKNKLDPKDQSVKKKPIKIVKKKSFPLPPQPKNYKQISIDEKNDDQHLIDYNSSHKCDLFGRKLPKFYTDLSGFATYSTRLDLKKIEPIHYKEYEYYYPRPNKYEGYSFFPRPLSLPFSKEYSNPKRIIEIMEKSHKVTLDENKKLFHIQPPSKDMSFVPKNMSLPLGKNSNKYRKAIIKQIDDYIEEQRILNIRNTDFVRNDPKIKSLLNLKKKLKANLNKNLYNNKIYSDNYCDKDIEKKFQLNEIMNKIIGFEKMHPNQRNINFNVYKQLYKISKVGLPTSIFKPQNNELLQQYLNGISKDEENDKENYLSKNKFHNSNESTLKFKSINNKSFDNKLSANILSHKDTQNIKKEKEKEGTKENVTNNKNEFTPNSTKYNKTFSTGFYVPKANENNCDITFHTKYASNLSSNFASANQTLSIYKPQLKEKTINNNGDNIEDLNVLDEEFNYKLTGKNKSQKQLKNNLFNANILSRTINNFMKKNNFEKKMLVGFKPNEEEPKEKIFKKSKSTTKNAGDHFRSEINLLKKVNKIAFEREEKKEQLYSKRLEKERKNKLVYDRIKMQ